MGVAFEMLLQLLGFLKDDMERARLEEEASGPVGAARCARAVPALCRVAAEGFVAEGLASMRCPSRHRRLGRA